MKNTPEMFAEMLDAVYKNASDVHQKYDLMQESETGRIALAAAAKKHGFGTKEREQELLRRQAEIKARNERLDAEEALRYGKKNEELEEEMTPTQIKKREEIVKAMKKDMKGLRDRYGDRAEEVMYATATKQAMKEDLDEAMDVHNKGSFKSQEMKYELGHEDKPSNTGYSKSSKTPTMKGMYFYNVPKGKEQDAAAYGIKQTKSGKWAICMYDTSGATFADSKKRADAEFGKGTWWEPKTSVKEGLDEAIVKLDLKRVLSKYPVLKDYGIRSITMVNGELHTVSDYSIKPSGITDSQIIGAASTKPIIENYDPSISRLQNLVKSAAALVERYDKDLDANDDGKLTAVDFKLLRAKKKEDDLKKEGIFDESINYKQLMMIALDGKPVKKDYTSAVAPNGDFVVHDRGVVVGRLKKGEWEHDLDESERSEKHKKVLNSLDRIMARAAANTKTVEIPKKKQVAERYDKDLDANDDGKLSAVDFKLLRAKKKEEEDLKKEDIVDESERSEKHKQVAERYDDDDDVRRADAELKRMKVKLPKVKHKEVAVKRTRKDKEEELEEARIKRPVIKTDNSLDDYWANSASASYKKDIEDGKSKKILLPLSKNKVKEELDEADTYGWRTTKTPEGHKWEVHAFTYGKGEKVLHSGLEDTRAKAVTRAKKHVMPYRRGEKSDDLTEAAREKKPEMKVYHPSYAHALQHAEDHLAKQGYTIHPDDWHHNISNGPSKPGEGKTNRISLPLHKDGVPVDKMAHIQVYNRGYDIPENMELNMYTSGTNRKKRVNESSDAAKVAQSSNGGNVYNVMPYNRVNTSAPVDTSSHASHAEVLKKLADHLDKQGDSTVLGVGDTNLPTNIPNPAKGSSSEFALQPADTAQKSTNVKILNSGETENPFQLSIWK
jgi:hypothetical protein